MASIFFCTRLIHNYEHPLCQQNYEQFLFGGDNDKIAGQRSLLHIRLLLYIVMKVWHGLVCLSLLCTARCVDRHQRPFFFLSTSQKRHFTVARKAGCWRHSRHGLLRWSLVIIGKSLASILLRPDDGLRCGLRLTIATHSGPSPALPWARAVRCSEHARSDAFFIFAKCPNNGDRLIA